MTYTKPHVKDYGSLLQLTADVHVHFTGMVSNLVVAALSTPLGHGVAGQVSTGGLSDSGGLGGGGLGGGGGVPGGGSKLPFTGFAALVAAGIGSSFVMFGAALRAALRRRPLARARSRP
ncbi:MAG: hypothetical protein QOE06_2829 [Thermoleophilaceae bacterium]|jgi:hypothetical protein|nr:hypothetical protein [Thermoleophilaceae bacterium]